MGSRSRGGYKLIENIPTPAQRQAPKPRPPRVCPRSSHGQQQRKYRRKPKP